MDIFPENITSGYSQLLHWIQNIIRFKTIAYNFNKVNRYINDDDNDLNI